MKKGRSSYAPAPRSIFRAALSSYPTTVGKPRTYLGAAPTTSAWDVDEASEPSAWALLPIADRVLLPVAPKGM